MIQHECCAGTIWQSNLKRLWKLQNEGRQTWAAFKKSWNWTIIQNWSTQNYLQFLVAIFEARKGGVIRSREDQMLRPNQKTIKKCLTKPIAATNFKRGQSDWTTNEQMTSVHEAIKSQVDVCNICNERPKVVVEADEYIWFYLIRPAYNL